MAEGANMGESWNFRPFVERKQMMDWLKEKYTTRGGTGNRQDHRYRIFGLHGKKRVGKSCLMQEFLRQIQHETSRNQQVYVKSFDFDKVKSFKSFLNELCNFFGVEKHKWNKDSGNSNNDDEEEDFTECRSEMERKMNDNPSNKFIIFLDNMECAWGKAKADGTAPDYKDKIFLWDKIYSEFISDLLPKCHNLLVFITSTQTAKFAELSQIACKNDLKEMTEEEAKCLLRTLVSGVSGVTEDILSSIVSLCDGLPPTIIKAGDMLCDGDYTHEQVAELLREFDNKMDLHGDDLFPKDDRYDVQLKKFINRLSEQNKMNLKSLAEMIHAQGEVGIDEAASKLKFDKNTAVFKLRFLLPLRFRGMVEVNKETGKISMNKFFCQYVRSFGIKGQLDEEEEAVKPACGYSSPSNGQSNGQDSSWNTKPSDDGDDFDDQSPAANHLIVPSHYTQDKSSVLLEEQNAHDDADNQNIAVNHMTVPSHYTQDASSQLLGDVSMSRKLEPNVAKMEGQYIGNRDEKPHYDMTLTNQFTEEFGDTAMRKNDLSPEEPSGEEMIAFKESSEDGMIYNKEGSGEGRIAKNQISMEEKVTNGGSSGEGSVTCEQKASPVKRSITLVENTMDTRKSQTDKDMIKMMSVEENYLQPSVGNFHRNIPDMKSNRAGSFDDNSLQDHCPEIDLNKEKDCQEKLRSFPVNTDKGKAHGEGKFDPVVYPDLVTLHSGRSATSNVTDSFGETLVKVPFSDNNRGVSDHITTMSQDHYSDTGMTDISAHVPSDQFEAMPYSDSKDLDEMDPLDSSFSSDRLFDSGRYNSRAAIHNTSQVKWPQLQSFDYVQSRPEQVVAETRELDGKQEKEKSHHTPLKLQTGTQEGRGLGTAPPTEAVASVQHEAGLIPNSASGANRRSQATGNGEDVVAGQVATGLFDSFSRFVKNTFQMFKEMES